MYVISSQLQVTLEGLALSYQQYTLVVPKKTPERAKDISRFGTGTTDILDIVAEVRAMRRDGDKNPDAWKNVEMIAKHFPDEFIEFTDRIKLPDFFDPKKEDTEQVVKLGDWILEICGVLYTATEKPNDFFLLHGVTGTSTQCCFVDVYLFMYKFICTKIDQQAIRHPVFLLGQKISEPVID